MKLNFGCGNRFSREWENIDFHSDDSNVRRVNLLAGFPYQDASMSAVYSSHVLEHFDRTMGSFLLKESFRVLRKGGILRIVVPDLQGSCDEYVRILSLPDDAEKKKLYSWIIIELLDQMVRNTRSGEMGSFVHKVSSGNDNDFKEYILSRTQTDFLHSTAPTQASLSSKLGKLTFQKLSTKLSYLYLKCVSQLIPSSLRSMVMVNTDIGERHRWMYDEYSLKLLFEEAGFSQIRRMTYNESALSDFNTFHLDCEADGTPYKRNSIFMEGVK